MGTPLTGRIIELAGLAWDNEAPNAMGQVRLMTPLESSGKGDWVCPRTAKCGARCDQEGSERKGQLSKGRISCPSCEDSSNTEQQSGGTTNSTSFERLTAIISSDLGGTSA